MSRTYTESNIIEAHTRGLKEGIEYSWYTNNMNITKIAGLFKGKKTYIVGILMILLGSIQGDTQMIMDGLGFIFLRIGINAQQ